MLCEVAFCAVAAVLRCPALEQYYTMSLVSIHHHCAVLPCSVHCLPVGCISYFTMTG